MAQIDHNMLHEEEEEGAPAHRGMGGAAALWGSEWLRFGWALWHGAVDERLVLERHLE